MGRFAVSLLWFVMNLCLPLDDRHILQAESQPQWTAHQVLRTCITITKVCMNKITYVCTGILETKHQNHDKESIHVLCDDYVIENS